MNTYDNATFTFDGKPFPCISPLFVRADGTRTRTLIVPILGCRKCAKQRVRRHARSCPKRGACHKGRGKEARAVEAWARIIVGVPVRVRRGRRGEGISLSAAMRGGMSRFTDTVACAIDRVIREPFPWDVWGVDVTTLLGKPAIGTRSATVDMIKEAFGEDAECDFTEPGTIKVTARASVADIHARQDVVRDNTPVGVRVVVNGLGI